jgi:drug/metabolite transporter (DMT)-like permease|tara:strand:+ start:56 stop:853 length:798 start_codon:yes stop_codon:yes gene_type:complete
MNALAKGMALQYTIVMVVWARYLSQTVLTVLVFNKNLKTIVKTQRIKIHLFRSALLFGATIFIFAGFANLSLAATMAIFQTAPLLVVILSVIFLGEVVGVKRWLGVAVGFAGALIIIQPGTDTFLIASIFPLLSALCYAAYAVSTRHLGTEEDPRTNFFYTGLVGTIVSTLILFPFFQKIELVDIIYFTLLGALGGSGHYCLILALRKSEASLLAPFSYFDLVFSACLGMIFFTEYPTQSLIIGATTIVGAGIYTWYRERVRSIN